MMRRYFQYMAFISLLLFCYGCQTTKANTDVKAYFMEKQRLDQEVAGPVGNWQNAPEAQSNQAKPTRRIFVVEFSKEADAPTYGDNVYDVGPIDKSIPDFERPEPQSSSPDPSPSLDLPSFEDEDAGGQTQSEGASSMTGAMEYTVQANDTLQKISKKFYDSYSKWPRIYEANKDKIQDPDNIVPGIVITIPAAE